MATDSVITAPGTRRGQWGGASAPPDARSAAMALRRRAGAEAPPHWMSLAIAGVLIGLTAVVATVAWQVREGQRLPDGPVQVVWNKEACAHCHMQVSQMQFAVQLQTADGDVLNFDDPGCFFLYLADERPEIHEVWFHHSREDRWLRRGEVAFVSAAATPMNFGLAAVARGEAGAMSYEDARERVVARPEVRS